MALTVDTQRGLEGVCNADLWSHVSNGTGCYGFSNCDTTHLVSLWTADATMQNERNAAARAHIEHSSTFLRVRWPLLQRRM